MGTSAAESFVASANIFVGMTEAPLLIRPFLRHLTRSEMHAVMTCGFATVAGGVLATYTSFGAPANHLIAASVMSCPAALVVAKLSFPETEELRIRVDNVEELTGTSEEMESSTVIEAAANGASNAIPMVANIAANLIAFLSIWSLLNALLGWAGEMVDVEGLSVEMLCEYVLWPLAFLMGVPAADCRNAGRLLGEKTLINEFVAYRHMSGMVQAGELSERAKVICTYALCGFSNIGSMAVQLGALGAMAPSRRPDMAKVVLRAAISGSTACFMTACIAGMLYVG